MTSDLSDQTKFREFAANLQKFELDKRIEQQCRKDSFRPVVHSEVLVYDWVMTQGTQLGLRFFRGWKYIGSSKPTCKLCDYFFDAVGGDIGRRPCHGNVYCNWRFPDGYGAKTSDRGSKVYFAMNNRIREDAFRIVSDKCSTGKSRDSDTYSCWTMRPPGAAGISMASSTQADTDSVVESLGSLLANIL